MGIQGWYGMANIAHAITAQKGNVSAEGTMRALKGWSFESSHGKVSIDSGTRDVIHDINVHQVAKENGRLKIRVIDSIPQGQDPCKALKTGK